MATNSPNMNLLLPTIGVDTGLTWEQAINANSLTLDGHNHSSGSGSQVTPSGLDINASLSMNNNNLTLTKSIIFYPQSPSLSGVAPYLGCIYVSGDDLYYNTVGGQQVQITSGGTLNAVSSGISSGTNVASFVSNILTVIQSAGVAGAIDAASYVLRYNGSYPSPSGNAIILQAPSTLASQYSITFPVSPPPSTRPIFMTTTGILSAGLITNAQIDASTILGSNIAAGTITGSNIDSQTITASNIQANTITNNEINSAAAILGSKLATNVVLPGSAVSADSRILVVANSNDATNIAVVQGRVNSNGTAVTGNIGFTSTRNGLGDYTVTYSAALGKVPSVCVTLETGSVLVWRVQSNTTSSFQLKVTDINYASPTAADSTFSFIAMGIRA